MKSVSPKDLLIIVGQGLYKFSDNKAALAFLEARAPAGKELDPSADPLIYGGEFLGRAPWEAVTRRDCDELKSILSVLEQE